MKSLGFMSKEVALNKMRETVRVNRYVYFVCGCRHAGRLVMSIVQWISLCYHFASRILNTLSDLYPRTG